MKILNEHRDIVNWTFDESNGKLFYNRQSYWCLKRESTKIPERIL
jgi:hypothetical protein